LRKYFHVIHPNQVVRRARSYSAYTAACPKCKQVYYIPRALRDRLRSFCEEVKIECWGCHEDFKPVMRTRRCNSCVHRIECLAVPLVGLKLTKSLMYYIRLLFGGLIVNGSNEI